jgi:cytochrome c oxidase assembly factor CtaG
MISLAVALAYVLATRRVERWPLRCTAAWLAGCAVLGLCLSLDDSRLELHMLQHAGIALVAPPLLLLGAPLRLALRATRGRARRALAGALVRSRAVAHPLVAWALFNATVLGVHLWGLGVRDPLSHGLEHAAMFWTAVLFWLPLVGAAPVPHRLGPLGALAYLMTAMPVMVGIALRLGGAPGAIMLGTGAVVTVAAVMGVVWPALLREESRQRAREGAAA